MADDVVNENPVPTDANQPDPGVTPDGSTQGPQPTPAGQEENVNDVGAAPASDQPQSGVQTSSDLQ